MLHFSSDISHKHGGPLHITLQMECCECAGLVAPLQHACLISAVGIIGMHLLQGVTVLTLAICMSCKQQQYWPVGRA